MPDDRIDGPPLLPIVPTYDGGLAAAAISFPTIYHSIHKKSLDELTRLGF